MTKAQATKIAREKLGPGVSLREFSGKSKRYGKCQIWLNQWSNRAVSRTRTMLAHGNTWEYALKEAGVTIAERSET